VEAARLYASAPAASILYAMGITQHTSGVDNVKSLANLAMLCGNVGVKGGGVNPLRGQNNVQGACDMGALPNVYTGYQKVDDADVKKRMAEAWGVSTLSDKPGLTATEMMDHAHAGDLKAMYIIGENPMVSDPDLGHAEKCLANLDFLVVQDIFLTETARMAHVVLPSAAFAEKDGSFTNTERKVQRVRKAVEPPGDALDDWKIIAGISSRMGYTMEYEDARAIMEEIARVTPSYCGINYDRLENEDIHWPCTGSDHPGTPCLHVDQFTCGLGVFHAIDYTPPDEVPDEEYPIFLTTGRVLAQYHTGTMTMKTPDLNGMDPECFVELSGQDARDYQIQNGDMIKVASRRGEIQARARISDQAVKGTIFIPFHYPDAAANVLTNPARDPIAKIPELKVCAVRIEKT
jgi:predicted molibdopterin-dependent oxidoreductase YjgC